MILRDLYRDVARGQRRIAIERRGDHWRVLEMSDQGFLFQAAGLTVLGATGAWLRRNRAVRSGGIPFGEVWT